MLVVLTSHPIQYQAPLWRAFAREVNVKQQVWFLTPHAVTASFDREFDQTFSWDQDLCSGYTNRFLDIRDSWRMDKFAGVRLRQSWEDEFVKYGVTHLWVEGWRFREFWRAISTAQRLGIKVLMRGETNDLRNRNTIKDFPRRVMLRSLFNRVDHFFYIGSANKRFYKNLGVEECRMSHAPYCVDNKFFLDAAEQLKNHRAQLRKRWRIPLNAFCFLFCGKFIAKKRVMDLAAAMNRFDGRFHALFVGSGEFESELRSQIPLAYDYANEHKSSETSHGKASASLTGFLNQSQLPTAYTAADCLVLPSDAGETWGLVTNEAMASGIPAIASNLCGCVEDLVEPLNSGFVFRCGSVDSLESAMRCVEKIRPERDRIHEIVSTHDITETTNALTRYFLP